MLMTPLKHFAAVAEELNFRRAADRLGIAQPSLSRSIQRLEHQMKVDLLERTRHQVRLTAAGRVFLDEARYLIARYEFASHLARREASGTQSRISISYSRPAWRFVLAPAIQTYQKRCPAVEVRLTECDADVQLAGLRDGKFDAGFVGTAGADMRGLETRLITQLRYLAAIPSGWPLAKRRTVKMSDFSGVPLILFNERLNPAAYSRLVLACQNAGFVPKLAQEVSQPHTLVDFVGAGLGVGFISEAARPLVTRGVTLRPIADLPDPAQLELSLVWVQRKFSPHLQEFFDIVERLLRASPAAG